nr:ADAMTS-like protein 2 isoform X2 [Paramormyrops kingsleyae]
MRFWLQGGTSLVLLAALTLSLCGNLNASKQKGGVASNSVAESMVTAHWWEEWSTWTACTRTCGGGITSQERHCLKQRKKNTMEKGNMTCTGNAKQYLLCNTKPVYCRSALPLGEVFERSSAGPSTHRSTMEGGSAGSPSILVTGRLETEPTPLTSKKHGFRHWGGCGATGEDYVHISSNPCDLHCSTLDGQRQLMVPARDGTSCKYRDYRGVCVNSKCEPVGCDGVLFSSHTLDKCGVCQGDGSHCRRVTGSFHQSASSAGYAFITQIPQGSWDIQVIERRKSADILAVTDQAGKFFFNGPYRMDNPQNFQAAGTIFKYRHPMNIHETGIEYIVAKGPINQPINILVWNQNGGSPYITYEYTEWQIPPALLMEGPLTDAGPVTNKGVSETDQNQVVGQEPRAEEVGQLKGQVTNEVYEGTVVIHSKQELLIPPHKPGKNSTQSGDMGAGEDPVTNKPSSENLIWNMFLGKSTASGMLHINFSTNQLLTVGQKLHSTEVEPPGPHATSLDGGAPFGHNSSLQERIHNNDTGHFLLLNRTLLHSFHSGNRTNHTRSHWKNSGLSTADMYRWKLSSQEPCSKSCSIGVARSFVTCVRYDGAEVDNTYCDNLTRPEPVHDFCIGRECQPRVTLYRWEASSWSECTHTCGEGFQFRLVRCWKMLAPGLDSSVYSDLCDLAHVERPVERRTCQNPTCGPQWEVAQWSECTAKCGHWSQVTRDVRCSDEMNTCDESTRPASIKNCTGPSCERQWAASEWGPCSGSCGQGMMIRHVYCKTSDGHVMPDAQCPAEDRPLAIHSCGSLDCPPHWIVQDWDMCNTRCGRGIRRRTVLCAGITGGVFQVHEDSECAAGERPEDESTCFERPCFKWYTTPWSECTKTCGTGTRSRDVKCYQGRELVKGCDPLTKPTSKQVCPLDPCPTQPPDGNCKDQPDTNCSLALQVNLCSHWYYGKACCRSCRGPYF